MLRDTLVGLIEPRSRGAGVHCSRAGFFPCCSRHRTIDPQCLENPRPAGAESTLTENARSPFHAEPRHYQEMLTQLDHCPRENKHPFEPRRSSKLRRT
jgi:hypothetical protein